MENKLAPSILSADFKTLGEQICMTWEGGAKYLHFDVMDGMFVPSISFGMPVLKSIQGASPQIMDVHLMVTEPERYVEAFGEAGADILTVHLEACEDIHSVVDKIHAGGMKAGVSIKPATPVESLVPVLEKADMFLIMSVEPGFGGQAFIPETLDKIKALRKLLNDRGLHTDIEVDGGIYLTNIQEVLEAGANIIVAGSAVFTGCIIENVRKFMGILNQNE